jgi:hypothetical protein
LRKRGPPHLVAPRVDRDSLDGLGDQGGRDGRRGLLAPMLWIHDISGADVLILCGYTSPDHHAAREAREIGAA